MDIVFNCSKCGQELEVDSSGSGSEIQCPACGEAIMIPEPPAGTEAETTSALDGIPEAMGDTATATPAEPLAEESKAKENQNNPISASAAAKEEKHFSVPTREGPAEILIRKANKPLEVAAKESERRLRIKTIRHADCHELGKDRFDEAVTEMLQKIEEKFIISVHPISYTHLDAATQKLLVDYGVMIVFRG